MSVRLVVRAFSKCPFGFVAAVLGLTAIKCAAIDYSPVRISQIQGEQKGDISRFGFAGGHAAGLAACRNA
jgi:hypothetical protein